MKDKIIPFPTITSLASSQPNTQQPINSTFTSFEMDFTLKNEKNKKKNDKINNQKILPLKRKRRITTENIAIPTKGNTPCKILRKRSSWDLMRNLVKGISFIQRPEVFFIKNQVRLIVLFVFFLLFFF